MHRSTYVRSCKEGVLLRLLDYTYVTAIRFFIFLVRRAFLDGRPTDGTRKVCLLAATGRASGGVS